jgi:hypothetical protein
MDSRLEGEGRSDVSSPYQRIGGMV